MAVTRTRRLNATKKKQREKAAAKRAAAKKRDKVAAANVETFEGFPKTSAPISKARLKKEAEDEEGPKRKRTDDAKAKRTAAVPKRGTDDAKTKRTAAVPKRGTDDAKTKRTAAVPKRGTDDAKAKRKEAPRASKTKAIKASKMVDDYKALKTPDVDTFKGLSTHRVKKGDTLSAIAKKMGTTIKALMAANPSIKNPNMIRIGQTIKGPIGSTTNPYKGFKKGELAKSKKKAEQDKLARLDARMRKKDRYKAIDFQSGGMNGAADMSAKKTSAPKKKKMPQYYMGGGTIKKGKPYAYGGRVAKYKE